MSQLADPRTPVQYYGHEWSVLSRAQLTGRRVVLEPDVVRRDKYGRLLAYVYLDGRRYEDELLELGYARLFITPNGVHARVMLPEELAAKAARRGLWGAC